MRRITVLDTVLIDNFQITLNVAFWFPVVQGLRVQKPNFESAIRGTQVPTATELQKLRSGEWIEEIIPISINRRDVFTQRFYTLEELKPVAANIVREVYLNNLPKYQSVPEPLVSLNIYGTTYTDENNWVIRSETPTSQ